VTGLPDQAVADATDPVTGLPDQAVADATDPVAGQQMTPGVFAQADGRPFHQAPDGLEAYTRLGRVVSLLPRSTQTSSSDLRRNGEDKGQGGHFRFNVCQYATTGSRRSLPF